MSKVTLHNHVNIGDDNKPIIPNIVFKETVEKMKAGDKEVFSQILDQYSLTPFQRRFLKDLQNGNNY